MKDIFEVKKEVSRLVGAFMGSLASLLDVFRNEANGGNHLLAPKASLCNSTLLSYHKLVQAGLNADGDPIIETDLGQVSEILGSFIQQALQLRNDIQTYDARLGYSMEMAREIRILIQNIRSRKIEVGTNLESEYNKLVVGSQDQQSYINEIDSILTTLSNTIERIKVPEL